MDQDSSLSTSFDFNSQAGVMSLLASIRASVLTPAQKNELRDLVFLYANGGGDVSVRIALEQKLAAYNIKPVATKSSNAPVEAAVVLPFGSSRPAPMFSTPVVSPPAAVVSTPVPVTPVAPAPVAIPVAPVVPTAPTPQAVPVAPISEAPAPVVPQPVVLAPTPVPVAPPVVPTTAVQPPTPAPIVTPPPAVSAPAPVVPVAPAPLVAAAPAATGNPGVYLERIREIKSAVNAKVGNPVNLVDINNEVGREYMNALLDAMKRLSGGAAGQIDVAMQRLETAYQAVEVAVADHAKIAAIPVEHAAPAHVATTLPSTKPEFTPAAPDLVVAEEDIVPASPVPAAPARADFSISGPSGFEAVATPTPVSAPGAVVASSILEEKKVLTPKDLPLASSLATSASGSPLFTKEIDDGLEQLLSDWSLFKKSGLFGTGPKGREHPLFKKLAELQIPLLLAGRFEGSTQEIKQSITDYMNGWRYEQGIIYEQGETFEHYLRRVIKQILDLQKKRRPA
jgi:hypothetical protein